MINTTDRTTKYVLSTVAYLRNVGHATNADILRALKVEFPALSPTTVHRVTARLLERGELALAPAAPDGAMRYDANTTPHDHFMCGSCAKIRDVNIADAVRPMLEAQIQGCHIGGRMTVSGTCKDCLGSES